MTKLNSDYGGVSYLALVAAISCLSLTAGEALAQSNTGDRSTTLSSSAANAEITNIGMIKTSYANSEGIYAEGANAKIINSGTIK